VAPSACVDSKNSIAAKPGHHHPAGHKTKIGQTSAVSVLATALQLSAPHHNSLSRPVEDMRRHKFYELISCNLYFGDVLDANNNMIGATY
jgi:hypothetical protein